MTMKRREFIGKEGVHAYFDTLTLNHKSEHRSPMGPKSKDWLRTALLVIATFAAYLPAWNGTPIWDDDAHLTKAGNCARWRD